MRKTKSLLLALLLAACLFPLQMAATAFEGQGTEESPYLLKTKADLEALAAAVNIGSENSYTKVFEGKVFRLDADIDMGSEAFTPIGNSAWNGFAGTFDGNKHTIANLTIDTKENGYAGLFGKCDTMAVVKNVTLKNANVKGGGYYTGAVAALCYGTVENCRVEGSTVTSAGRYVGAVAGQAATLTGCTVDNCEVYAAAGNGGGVCGFVSKKIANSRCRSTQLFAGGADETPSGGVAAVLYQGAVAEACYFSGVIDAIHYNSTNLQIGGCFGSVVLGTVNACFSTATISAQGSDAAVGGVVGALAGTVTNCYNIGRVMDSSSKYTGGVVGYVTAFKTPDGTLHQTTITNCFSAGQIVAETYGYKPESEQREVIGTVFEQASPTINNVYFDSQLIDFGSANHRSTTAQLTAGSGVEGFPADVWTFTEGLYPRLKAFQGDDISDWSASAIVMPGGASATKLNADAQLNAASDATEFFLCLSKDGAPTLSKTGHHSFIEGNTLKVSNTFGNDTLFIKNGTTMRFIILKISPIVFQGEGTAENPYLLKTKDDLVALSKATNTAQQYFADTYFRVDNDIDMEKDTTFTGLCTGGEDVYAEFKGHIDGAGHTLHNMVVNGMLWDEKEGNDTTTWSYSSDSKDCMAFVGVLGKEGSISNLTLAADCRFEGKNYVAAFAAKSSGTISNCTNLAPVVCYNNYGGGIVGEMVRTDDNLPQGEAVISHCINHGVVKASNNYAGGIAAYGYGTLNMCTNTAEVTARQLTSKRAKLQKNAGGIVGYSSGIYMKDVRNSGAVYAGLKQAGGIAGYLGGSETGDVVMRNAVNEGPVACDGSFVGGIVGYQSGEGATADSCINSAPVYATEAVGGIVGYQSGKAAKYTRCVNIGQVNTTGAMAGGLVGQAEDGGLFEASVNGGKVLSTASSTETAYAVGGLAGQAGASFKRCANMGTVSARAFVGGLVGQSVKDATLLQLCYNAAAIEAPADSCGNLVGSTDEQFWNNEYMDSCSFVTDYGTFGTPIGTALTMKQLAMADMGTNFDNGDDYTLPLPLELYSVTPANIYAAAVVLEEGSTYNLVTGNFHVGLPDGIIWQSDNPVLAFEGNNATFANTSFKGLIKITASSGSYSRTIQLNCDLTKSGINSQTAATNTISTTYYNADGTMVPAHSLQKGRLYIVVEKKADGSLKTSKKQY